MNYFLKANKNLLTYSLIILIVIPIFGFNFFISFIGNILNDRWVNKIGSSSTLTTGIDINQLKRKSKIGMVFNHLELFLIVLGTVLVVFWPGRPEPENNQDGSQHIQTISKTTPTRPATITHDTSATFGGAPGARSAPGSRC